MNLQEHFLRKALSEKGITFNKIECDHTDGTNYIDGKGRKLVFPDSLFELCQCLECPKSLDYFFYGSITRKRQWLYDFNKNSIIERSDRGRTIEKFFYHGDYYLGLSRAKFALCPVGDYNWSYRLFEAVMCGCIPIIEECDLFHNVFFHYHKDEQHIYLPEKAKENLKILVSNYLL